VCGRFVSATSPEQVAERFHVDESRISDYSPDYNVAPRQGVFAVRERVPREGADTEPPRRYLDRLRWGLVPSWARDPAIGDRMINARAETIAAKPGYRRSFEKRRCIIPADGFYEWHAREGRGKQPVYIRRRDGELLAFAGLWSAWRVPEVGEDDADGWLRSCAIVTTRANELVAPIHDRMPVVLPAAAWDPWLDPANQDTGSLRALLEPAPAGWFEAIPVSTRVNRPENNGAELIERAGAERSQR